MIKKPFLSFLIIVLLCTSCTASKEPLNPPPPVPTPNQQTAIQQNKNPFPYSFFELKAIYHGIEDKLLIQYRYMDNEIYVKYTDHDSNTDLNGEKAYEIIKPKLTELAITKKTGPEEIMKELFEQFPIRKDYRKVEVKVRFNDGEEKVFKRFSD